MYTRVSKMATLLAVATMFIFAACEKDDDSPAKPEIGELELGTSNNQIGVIGSDLHVEVEVVAEAKIDYITIEIHQEDEEEEEKSIVLTMDEDAWEMDTTYTEFSGLKNTTFHKHVEIPLDAIAGDYHFHFIVTDMEGQQTTVEEELTIQEPSDSTYPEMTVSSAPSENATFASGETISISGSISDDIALGGIYIGLVREDQNLSDADVDEDNTIALLHNHDFESATSYDFSASIVVGASQDNDITPKDIEGDIAWQSANYYILVKCKDEFGSNWTYSEHYPVVINY